MQHPYDDRDDAEMFNLAPVSLWLEDYSGIKTLFDEWRGAGLTDLRAHLIADPQRVKICSQRIRIIKVNLKTLALFEAADAGHLIANLERVFRDDMLTSHIEELCQLWDGNLTFSSHAVNYTLSGRRVEIQLSGGILPGHEANWDRVLVSIEDVTQREAARQAAAVSEAYARGLFEHSPISLWVEDFSAIKTLIDEVREQGIVDFRIFTDVHPEFVARCMREIHVLDVNRETLELFGAPDKTTLLQNLGEVFRDDMVPHFREQLIDLWDGKLFQRREVVNYALNGQPLHVHMQFSVLPGHEADWSLVQVALTDITARKKAEAYLEFLGKHDVLTKLYNRSFFVDEIARLDRRGPFPVTVIMLDLNGLKPVNDRLGHAAGDGLLRRVGEILSKAVEKPHYAARIGGDEFVVLMPATGEAGGHAMIESIRGILNINNQFHSQIPLDLSIAAATGQEGERIESIVRRADQLMYAEKRRHYVELEHDRRNAGYPEEQSDPATAPAAIDRVETAGPSQC